MSESALMRIQVSFYSMPIKCSRSMHVLTNRLTANAMSGCVIVAIEERRQLVNRSLDQRMVHHKE